MPIDTDVCRRDSKSPEKTRSSVLFKCHRCLIKAMVFPVVMYGCETWTVKKAERQRIDAFGLWCWRRLLRVPWTARRSNQSVLKEIRDRKSTRLNSSHQLISYAVFCLKK